MRIIVYWGLYHCPCFLEIPIERAETSLAAFGVHVGSM